MPGFGVRLRFLVGALSLLLLFCVSIGSAEASAPRQDGGGADVCATCHATPGLQEQFPNGETLSVTVAPDVFKKSVHGNRLQCTACHTDKNGWPHPEPGTIRTAVRDQTVLIRSYTVCADCHPDQYTRYLGSVHAARLAEGDAKSAVCSDCHGTHDMGPANAQQDGLALAPAVYSCQKCHEDEFNQYRESAHGRALLERGDPNVPGCVDCHDSHGMGPAKDDVAFRRQSPYMCASCHADKQLMAEYHLSTDVLDSYVADYHGTTVQLSEMGDGQELHQAVCTDCHGVHDIKNKVDPGATVVRANLVTKCQECHEDAPAGFANAWVGHQKPSPTVAAPVYWTARFFTLLTVAAMAGLVGHIILDMLRALLNALRGGRS